MVYISYIFSHIFFSFFENSAVTCSFESTITIHELQYKCTIRQNEFDNFQSILIRNGINVLRFEESTLYDTPDALFPNNWFIHLPDGRVFLMPMFPKNRRNEYRKDIIFDYSCNCYREAWVRVR